LAFPQELEGPQGTFNNQPRHNPPPSIPFTRRWLCWETAKQPWFCPTSPPRPPNSHPKCHTTDAGQAPRRLGKVNPFPFARLVFFGPRPTPPHHLYIRPPLGPKTTQLGVYGGGPPPSPRGWAAPKLARPETSPFFFFLGNQFLFGLLTRRNRAIHRPNGNPSRRGLGARPSANKIPHFQGRSPPPWAQQFRPMGRKIPKRAFLPNHPWKEFFPFARRVNRSTGIIFFRPPELRRPPLGGAPPPPFSAGLVTAESPLWAPITKTGGPKCRVWCPPRPPIQAAAPKSPEQTKPQKGWVWARSLARIPSPHLPPQEQVPTIPLGWAPQIMSTQPPIN